MSSLMRRVGLGRRGGVHAVLLEEADDPLAALPAARVLAAGGAGAEVAGEADGREHLLLLRAEVTGLERDGLLHRGEGEQLQQVVLDHVARGADAVVVAGPATDADVLGHRDLHVVDGVRVPDRLEQHVREPQREQVLDRLLAEVVVDAEHGVGGEHPLDDGVQLAGGLEVGAERLLDHDAAPAAVALLGEPGGGEVLGDLREVARRDREVERGVAERAALRLERGRASRAGGRSRPGRRTCPARTGCRGRAAARPPRGTACAPRPARPPGRPRRTARPSSRGGRSPTSANPGGSRPRFARS